MGSGGIAAGMNNGANTPLPLPVPQPQVPTVPAPGQRGPKGLAGRQTYSRVNTGAPQSADAGAYAQKSIPPAGAETTKTSEVTMSIAARPTIQDMMKAAMAGTASASGTAVSRIKVAEEAKRQLDSEEDKPPSKEKKKKDEDEDDSGERAEKLAAAAEYCAELLEKNAADLAGSYTLTETPMAPGKGPNALEISESPALSPVNQKSTGQAVAGDQPPMNPSTQKAMPQERGGTQMDNDADRAPAAGDPPMSGSTKNASAKLARVKKIAFSVTPEGHKYDAASARIKERAALEQMALSQGMGAAGFNGPDGKMQSGSLGKAFRGFNSGIVDASQRGEDPRHMAYVASKHEGGGNAWNPLGGALTPHPAEMNGTAWRGGKVTAESIKGSKKGKEKKASVASIRALKKQAEDAGSPSKISAGAVQQDDQGPPGVLNSSEAGPPAQDKGKVPVGHDATRAFTRAEAKATPKKEMRAVLDEPMMSSQTDKVLDVNLDHDGDSKISSIQEVTKIAAARALLNNVRKQLRN